jgi:hypothetical protein
MGLVKSFAILDNPTAGNFLYIGDLTSAILINSGTPVEFMVGSLSVSEV